MVLQTTIPRALFVTTRVDLSLIVSVPAIFFRDFTNHTLCNMKTLQDEEKALRQRLDENLRLQVPAAFVKQDRGVQSRYNCPSPRLARVRRVFLAPTRRQHQNEQKRKGKATKTRKSGGTPFGQWGAITSRDKWGWGAAFFEPQESAHFPAPLPKRNGHPTGGGGFWVGAPSPQPPPPLS